MGAFQSAGKVQVRPGNDESSLAPERRGAMKIALVLCMTLVLTVPGFAQDIIVVTEQWPPYNFSGNEETHAGASEALHGFMALAGLAAPRPSGSVEVQGVVTEIVHETLSRAGLDYTIEVMPWSRAYTTAMHSENVMIYSIFKLPSREPLFQWIPLHGPAVAMYLFKPAHRTDIQVHDLESAKQYVVGVTRDTSTHHFLVEKGFVEGDNLVPLASEEQNIQMTLPGVERTDLLTGDRLSLAHWLSQSGLNMDYLEEVTFLFQEEFYFAFGQETSPEVVEKIRSAVEELAADGTIERIMSEYYESLSSGIR